MTTLAERRVHDITAALITFALALGPPIRTTTTRIPTQPGPPTTEHTRTLVP